MVKSLHTANNSLMLTTTTLMVTEDGWRAQVTHSVTNPQETKAVLMSLPEPASDYYLASSDGVWKEQIRIEPQSAISITQRIAATVLARGIILLVYSTL